MDFIENTKTGGFFKEKIEDDGQGGTITYTSKEHSVTEILDCLKLELDTKKSDKVKLRDRVKDLNVQIDTLTSEIDTAKQNLADFKASQKK